VFRIKNLNEMKNHKNAFLTVGLLFFGLLSCDSDKAAEQTVAIENITTSTETKEVSDLPSLSSIQELRPAASSSPPPPSNLNNVGPLASSIVNTSTPQAVAAAPQATNSSVVVNAPASKSNVRLNPAHGLPGHDCAVAVGAPLKSSTKSAPAVAKPVVASTPVQTNAVAEPVVNLGANKDPKAKINPAHGQPGHVCSVAVGAPLPAN
jgi:hypothetical protein